MAQGIHTEQTFESEIEAHLLAHGYASASSNDFDREKALFTQQVIDFVQATQPKTWEKLAAIHQGGNTIFANASASGAAAGECGA